MYFGLKVCSFSYIQQVTLTAEEWTSSVCMRAYISSSALVLPLNYINVYIGN